MRRSWRTVAHKDRVTDPIGPYVFGKGSIFLLSNMLNARTHCARQTAAHEVRDAQFRTGTGQEVTPPSKVGEQAPCQCTPHAVHVPQAKHSTGQSPPKT